MPAARSFCVPFLLSLVPLFPRSPSGSAGTQTPGRVCFLERVRCSVRDRPVESGLSGRAKTCGTACFMYAIAVAPAFQTIQTSSCPCLPPVKENCLCAAHCVRYSTLHVPLTEHVSPHLAGTSVMATSNRHAAPDQPLHEQPERGFWNPFRTIHLRIGFKVSPPLVFSVFCNVCLLSTFM